MQPNKFLRTEIKKINALIFYIKKLDDSCNSNNTAYQPNFNFHLKKCKEINNKKSKVRRKNGRGGRSRRQQAAAAGEAAGRSETQNKTEENNKEQEISETENEQAVEK